MKRKVKVFFLAMCLSAVCFLNFSSNSLAAEEQLSIKISPAVIKEEVLPGEILSQNLKITNKSSKEAMMYAYLMDFKAADDYGKVELISPGSEEGQYISSWVKISSEPVLFAPNEEKTIPFTIEIPANTGPGGYYGAIVFGTDAPKIRPGEEDKGAAVGIAQRTTSLILLKVPGKLDERAIIREFRTDKRLYSNPFEVKFKTKIENQGNVFIEPNGIIEIKNMVGRKVTTLYVNEDGHSIISNSARIFESLWKDSFGFGKYEADLALSYGTPADKGGEGKKTLTMVWYFWILPIKVVVTVGLSIIITLALFVLFLQMYKRKAIKEAMAQIGQRASLRKKTFNNSPFGSYLSTFFTLLAIAVILGAIIYLFLF